MMDCEVITVNYNTPDLIDRLVNSIRINEGNIPMRIIDGTDNPELALKEMDNVIIDHQGWNIHHGRGMDLALSTSKYKYCLIIDSDNYIKKPIVSYMLNNIGSHKMFGFYCYVNDKGIDNKRQKDSEHNIKYYHPSFLMINTEFYRSSKTKMIHHGAPCIDFMKEHRENIDKLAIDLCEFLMLDYHELENIISLENRGTVSRYGYNLK